jgi:DNA-directed RNA polymerase subunit RPC12/RpoP
MALKTCPICLGDVPADSVSGDGESRCTLCGYRLHVETRSPWLAQDRSTALMTTAEQEWPYPVRQFRRNRQRVVV